MQKQLADGLILRTLREGVASDRARLPQFYAAVNGEGEAAWVPDALAAWTEDLMTGHPTTTPDRARSKRSSPRTCSRWSRACPRPIAKP